jgi:YfiH family protein
MARVGAVNGTLQTGRDTPHAADGFEWVAQAWGRSLRCAPLASHATHLFTTRDLALRGHDTETTRRWALVASAIDRDAATLIRLKQVHGTEVAVVRAGRTRADGLLEADAVITDDPAAALCVQAADCVPILLVHSRSHAVAAVHAGWRGLARGIVTRVVDALCSTFGGSPRDTVAAVGPSIGPCCYVVGEDVRSAFEGMFPTEVVRPWFLAPYRHSEVQARCAEAAFAKSPRLERLDLWTAAADQLARAGVSPDRISVATLCTAAHVETFYSYRVEGKGVGRNVGVIAMKPEPR